MEQKIVIEQPVKYERKGDRNTGTLIVTNDGWVTEDKETFSRLLRKETFHYTDGVEREETDVVIETLETLKGTKFLKRKLAGKLFDDVQ